MTAQVAARWVVLKFGGTSVATLPSWQNIARVTRSRLAAGTRVVIVHSAVSGVTDRLGALLGAALRGEHQALLLAIEERHRSLATELGVGTSDELERALAELSQICAGIALVGEVSDRIRARVMAAGELMATEIGSRYLRAEGLDATWVDARTILLAQERGSASARANSLAATCDFSPDPALASRLGALTPVLVTQGFIARDGAGHTVLLGRGGSDTSGAYLAAKLAAERLEIWTDVPGMFSANPRSTPTARLLRALHYDEAQEIASNGAKVLHPRCILPVRQHRIPLHVYATGTPDVQGTVITAAAGAGAAQVKAVCIKKGITLVSMESPGMWHEVGFLADAFAIFKAHGLSVDLVSTSETNVTVSLDPAANSLDEEILAGLVADLSRRCHAEVIGGCAAVSLVGRNIRGILHQLGEALELFAEQKIYLVSQAANDLNLTFVVDEDQGDRLVEQLHELLIRPVPGDEVLGPTWEQLFEPPGRALAEPWWRAHRPALLAALDARDAAYVYHRESIAAQARALAAMPGVDLALYAIKANPHPEVLRIAHQAGLGMECVSLGELERVLAAIPSIDRRRILFTPNFAPRGEYAAAFELGVRVTLDNGYPLAAWPEVFRNHEIFLRVDPGTGRGHHQHVRTAGAHSKFGIPLDGLDAVVVLAERAGVRITGLHGHLGSGITQVGSWGETAERLVELARRLPSVRVIDVGGGLGVPDRAGRRRSTLTPSAPPWHGSGRPIPGSSCGSSRGDI